MYKSPVLPIFSMIVQYEMLGESDDGNYDVDMMVCEILMMIMMLNEVITMTDLVIMMP